MKWRRLTSVRYLHCLEGEVRKSGDSLLDGARRKRNPSSALRCIVLVGVAAMAHDAGSAAAQELRPGQSYFGLPSASGEVTALFGERTAFVDGVEPGGGLLWLTVWRERVGDLWTRVVRDLGFAPDSDADGAVELEFEDKIPTLSTWVVVDLDAPQLDVDAIEAQKFDGQRLDLVAPSPFLVRPLTVALREVESSAPYFECRGIDLEVLWLRPQVGVWHASIRDGGEGDLDGVGDRRIRFDASAFEAVFPEKLDPPDQPSAGDVVLGVEATSLRAFVAQVEK